MSSDFRQKTIDGISWSVVGQLGNQVLQFVVTVVLARLLSPHEFGLMSMLIIFTGFAQIFQGVGLGAAVVQYQDITQKHLSSVFWANVASGVVLTGLLAASAPAIASFYEEPILTPMALVVSFTFVITSLSIVHNTLLQKAVDFKTIALMDVGAKLVSGSVAIAMAATGYGVWSLVASTLLHAAASSVILWAVSPWRPSFAFSLDALKDLWGFSVNLLGTQTMNYWVRRLDDLLVGRSLGSDALGVYTKAYGIMLLPLTGVSRVLSRVMFPSLSAIQDDVERVRRVYLRMTRTIALVTFPLMLGLLATAEAFVLGVFGAQWAAMVPPLQVFCLTGLWQSITTLNGNLYMSQGRTDLQFRVGLVTKSLLIVGIVGGLQWGMMGVVVGYSTASFVNTYLTFRYAGRLVDLTFGTLTWNLVGVFGCAAAMGALVFGLGFALPATWPPLLRLATQVTAGVMLYWGFVHGFGVQSYREVLALLAEQWTRRRPTS